MSAFFPDEASGRFSDEFLISTLNPMASGVISGDPQVTFKETGAETGGFLGWRARRCFGSEVLAHSLKEFIADESADFDDRPPDGFFPPLRGVGV